MGEEIREDATEDTQEIILEKPSGKFLHILGEISVHFRTSDMARLASVITFLSENERLKNLVFPQDGIDGAKELIEDFLKNLDAAKKKKELLERLEEDLEKMSQRQ